MKKKPTVAKPWFYDRSKFIRSEEEKVWRENASDSPVIPELRRVVEEIAAAEQAVIVEAPPAAPEPVAPTPEPKPPPPSIELTPTAPSLPLGLWKRLWKSLTG